MSIPGFIYHLCDSESAVNRALTTLRSASDIIVDCEGETLGKIGGSLSIISLGSTSTMDIFLIDVLRLHNSLSPVFDLLQSTEMVKIVFDGRMDFSALYHEFGVHLRNVIDLQLVDIRSRRSRGETNVGRVSRLGSYLNARHIASMPDLYASGVKLNALSLCIKEHLGQSDLKKPAVNHSGWLRRPLSQEYLSYAATDIHLMGLLHDEFSAKGYIHMPELRAQSARYVELWKDEKPTNSITKSMGS